MRLFKMQTATHQTLKINQRFFKKQFPNIIFILKFCEVENFRNFILINGPSLD